LRAPSKAPIARGSLGDRVCLQQILRQSDRKVSSSFPSLE
jgi:hypothetical protein